MSAPRGYPGEVAREQELDMQARALGAELLRIGTSVEARAIRCVRVPSQMPNAPRVLVNANIHGPEWIASRTAMAFLAALAHDNSIRTLREVAEVWVVPCINVDGYARTERVGGAGTLKALRTNANGVDLNRNFPIPRISHAGSLWRAFNPHFLALGGSDDVNSATYRGSAPLSEPEARAIDTLCADNAFVACVSLHSFMGTLIPPCVRTAQEAAAYRRLCRAFRSGQARKYLRFSNRRVDVLTGELEDRAHHDLGCWALTVECFSLWASLRQHLRAPSLFWRFNPRDPEPWAANDVPGIAAYLRAALAEPHPRRATT